ncbi:MAG TPA: M20/M25/M40 family metallo-hydrolase [Acidobacteriota bacterium]|nr:M20/M25/M40 family metallo-hydrolase [Acidobacteriota bacterium]
MRRMIAIVPVCLTLLSIRFAASGEEVLNPEMNIRIRDEGMYRSQIMRTLHFLTDVYSPRLTGSPNMKAAEEWAIQRMKEWGFENGHLEPWDFGHPGWLNERLSAQVVSPVKEALNCVVLGWTPSTKGVVTAPVVMLPVPERPTAEELTKRLEANRDNVRGKIVFVGKPQYVPVSFSTPPRRRDDQQLRAMYDPRNPSPMFPGRPQGGPQEPADPSRLTAAQITEKIDAFLLGNGALIKVADAAREHGQIRAFANRSYDPEKSIPSVVMRNEDYGRICRILDDGVPVTLEFEIVNRTYTEGKTTYNAVAEIPGTDKRDEVIMLGGHIDSWHAATGATDNAIGCAVMMEAARILKALGVKPRRTIRVGLWGGEEQGLLGSQAYVKEHFGSFEGPGQDFFKLDAYLNIDSGTGRARGLSIFGPPEAASILREIVAPFADLGVVGAIATRSRRLGGTDSTSFNQAGLPGVGISQDPIEYMTDTWHTNLDTYERVVESDAKSSAIVIAAVVYQLAMREEALPRLTKTEMPEPPPAPTRP